MPSIPPPPPPVIDDELPWGASELAMSASDLPWGARDLAKGTSDLPWAASDLPKGTSDQPDLGALRLALDVDTADVSQFKDLAIDDEEPYAIALFDYYTDHHDDLCFSVSSRSGACYIASITLL